MGAFVRQLGALIHKNVLVSVVRRPVGFVLSVYAVPLAILGLLFSIHGLVPTFNAPGISEPGAIRPLAETVHKKLVVVRPPELGSDIDAVIEAVARPVVAKGQPVVVDDSEAAALERCLPNVRGVSDCHAVVVFRDSPLTTRAANSSANGHGWSYTILADPARDNRAFDVSRRRSDQEDLYLPLQLAVNQAITGSAATPETVVFTPEPRPSDTDPSQVPNAYIVGKMLAFALIFAHFTVIYRTTVFITAERDAGLSQLIDSMGGRGTVAARVLACIVTVDLVALPMYLAAAVLYQRLVFPASGLGLLLGWQVLTGFAFNSSTAFAAAFFSKSRVSAVYVLCVFLALSMATQTYASEAEPHPHAVVVRLLAFFFPSANHVFSAQLMTLWQLAGRAADPAVFPPETDGLWAASHGVSQGSMLGYLAADAVLYAVAAMAVEQLLHGIHSAKRRFSSPAPHASAVVAETVDIRKRFSPGLLTRILCCGRKKAVQAVDGVSFRAYMGQIMCLVGPNGSGKTTTLHMMAGFTGPSAGSVAFGARPSQIGICPQRNTLWDELTVEEHVSLWDRIKSGNRSPAALDELIQQCDLGPKRRFRAGQLSGGQKRKLQLACMFVGDSTVCLIDECTSGLDPLSRRAIWEILLDQRSRRSIILTTHFLDEVDVLADHIVLLAQGRVKCHGPSAQLKNLHGGGYRVTAPLTAAQFGHGYPFSVHQDRLVYQVPDSRVAAQLVSSLAAAGIPDVAVSGPQFEDVFLNLLRDDGALESVKTTGTAGSGSGDFDMTPGRVTSFWSQFIVLYAKRWTVFKRFWGPYLFVLLVPVLVTFLMGPTMKDYETPSCDALQDFGSPLENAVLMWNASCPQQRSCQQLAVAPRTANATLAGLVEKRYGEMRQVDPATYAGFVSVQETRGEMLERIEQNRDRAGHGGIFAGSSTEAPLIAYKMEPYGAQSGSALLNVWSQMESGLEINSSQELMPKSRKGGDDSSLFYVFYFCLLQIVYPAFFVLYPALEKARMARALQYANGVRRAPLWVAYGTFDFLWVFIVSVLITLITASHFKFNGPSGIMLPTLALYGVAATLMGYAVAHFTSGPLKAFMATLGVGMASFAVVGISLGGSDGGASGGSPNDALNGLTFGGNLFMPIGNVFRMLLLAVNWSGVGCKDGQRVPTGSINGFGGPLLYLVLQVMALLLIIVWLEGGLPRLLPSKAAAVPPRDADVELSTMQSYGTPADTKGGVAGEVTRAERTGSDPLRAIHVSKAFGSNQAVDDLTFGLARGEVMALIGPNGAGKSTLVNMIQGELAPDRGKVQLCGEDSMSPAARKNLGVCPQYDALDLMSTRDQLFFYARIKGIRKPKHDVEHLMNRLGLAPHAKTQASKLSGGKKRKLMLAVALMGTPPVVVLDEPTSAMDAVAKRAFWRLVQDIAAERSVLLTTHSMEEADALATRTAIMARRFLAIGTTQNLRERYSNIYVGLVLTSAPTSRPDEMARVGAWVQNLVPGARFEREMLGGQVRFTFPAAPSGPGEPSPVAALIEALERDKDRMGVEFYSISGPTLENVFLSVVRENQVQEEDGAGKRPLWKRLLKRG